MFDPTDPERLNTFVSDYVPAHPFGKESEKDLAAIAEDPDLHVIVGPTGWYGRGTVFIEIWRRDMFEAAQAYLEYWRATDGT